MPMVAWYMLSKESYMKRVIREVFPTDCSPRNTSLNLGDKVSTSRKCKIDLIGEELDEEKPLRGQIVVVEKSLLLQWVRI